MIATMLLAWMVLAAPNDPSTLREVRSQLNALFRSTRGIFACAVEDLETGDRIFIREHAVFRPASTMKTAVMVEVFRQAEGGYLSLEDSILVKNRFASVVDGSPFRVKTNEDGDSLVIRAIGTKMNVRNLVERMIIRSSNLATNLLIERVTPDSVTKTMRAMGATKTRIVSGRDDTKAAAKGLQNATTALDQLILMKAIAEGAAVNPRASSEMHDILARQEHRHKIPRLLPEEVRVAHKTGSIPGAEHDTGIIELPDGRRYVLVLLSTSLRSNRSGIRVLSKASQIVYEGMRK